MVVGMAAGMAGEYGNGGGYESQWVWKWRWVVGGGGVGHTVAAAAARYVWWRPVGFCWVLDMLFVGDSTSFWGGVVVVWKGEIHGGRDLGLGLVG